MYRIVEVYNLHSVQRCTMPFRLLCSHSSPRDLIPHTSVQMYSTYSSLHSTLHSDVLYIVHSALMFSEQYTDVLCTVHCLQ